MLASLGMGKTVDCAVTEEDYRKFMGWLRCYENPDMNNMVDHNGRTIWFKVPNIHKGLSVNVDSFLNP